MTEQDTTWTEVEVQYDFQSALWEADDESAAVVIERREEPWLDDPEYDAFVLHPMYEENPEPETTLAEGVTEREAHEAAMAHMRG